MSTIKKPWERFHHGHKTKKAVGNSFYPRPRFQFFSFNDQREAVDSRWHQTTTNSGQDRCQNKPCEADPSSTLLSFSFLNTTPILCQEDFPKFFLKSKQTRWSSSSLQKNHPFTSVPVRGHFALWFLLITTPILSLTRASRRKVSNCFILNPSNVALAVAFLQRSSDTCRSK